MNKDVIAAITDGTSLMGKFKKICPEHVTCYAHAIHLAVCDILDKKPQPKSSEDFIYLVNDCKSDTKTTPLLKVILRRKK